MCRCVMISFDAEDVLDRLPCFRSTLVNLQHKPISPHMQRAQHGNTRLCHASERGRTTATWHAMQPERV